MRYPCQSTRKRSRYRLLIFVGVSIFLPVWASSDAQARPINVTPPTITGNPEVGQVLTASPGTWRDSSSPIVAYQYAWMLCPFPGECLFDSSANSSFWTLPWEAVGQEAEVSVYAVDEEGVWEVATGGPTPTIAYNGAYYGVSESVSGSGFIRGWSAGLSDSTLLCPGQCGYDHYISGKNIELVAEPALGATFLGWDGACSGTSPTCSFKVEANKSVTARFSTLPSVRVSEGIETGPAAGATTRASPLDNGTGAIYTEGATLDQGNGTPGSSGARRQARLLGLHAGRRHSLRAVVACQQSQPCHLVLAVSSDSPSARLVASRALTLAGGHSAHVSLALGREGARLLARRRRLPVSALLTLREGGRSVGVGRARLTLVS